MTWWDDLFQWSSCKPLQRSEIFSNSHRCKSCETKVLTKVFGLNLISDLTTKIKSLSTLINIDKQTFYDLSLIVMQSSWWNIPLFVITYFISDDPYHHSYCNLNVLVSGNLCTTWNLKKKTHPSGNDVAWSLHHQFTSHRDCCYNSFLNVVTVLDFVQWESTLPVVR